MASKWMQGIHNIALLHSFMIVFSSGILGYRDGSVPAAVLAVILVHCVIAAYVYAAWKEGTTKSD